MRYRERYTLLPRKLTDGTVVFSIRYYDQHGKRITVSSHQTTKGKAREWAHVHIPDLAVLTATSWLM